MSSTSEHTSPSRSQALLLVLADAGVLYVAFVGALKARFGVWMLPTVDHDYGAAMGIAVGVYLVLLAGSGLYRTSPQAFHLSDFLRTSVVLLIAWTISVTLTYLATPLNMLPRSVTAVHVLLSMVGILGLRAVIRQVGEWRQPEQAPAMRLRTRPLRIDDVIPRDPVDVDRASLRNHLSGRTVLVTGAGGSIGSELSRQLIALRPFRLVLVDVSEFNLFQLENALRREAFEGELEFRIADIRDREMMDSLFSRFQPDVVLHAAAYKHVPLMERHPIEAFRNNTLATVELLRLCEQSCTEQFVFVSTDKAVEPSSVLGATKRLAEWYVQAVRFDVRCKIVRFGNVFGSQGSVVPLFQEQIEKGEAVTVTHPDMERYFMSADEACSLILQTLLLETAPVYILKMGAAVRIQWLAERMIRRLRPSADPQMLIEYIGIRPGEKLQEELWSGMETPITTPHPSIIGLTNTASHSRAELDVHLADLEDLCLEHRSEQLRKALFAAEPKAVHRSSHE